MLKLNLLLKLQAAFAAASVSYLVASGIRAQTVGEPLSAAPVVPSILMFAIYSGCLLLPRAGRVGWYRIAMIPAILAFGGGGVIANVVTYFSGGSGNYAGFGAWLLAVAINTYGTALNILAALGWFQPKGQSVRTSH